MKHSNYYILIKQNFKIVIKNTVFSALVILALIPYVFGTSNLNSVKAAECLEKMVALIGIPLFVPLLKLEQDDAIREVIFTRVFSHRVIVIFRLIMAVMLTFISIYFFELYMVWHGCIFPIYKYLFRTAMAAMLIGGCGLCASAIARNTFVGYLIGFVYYFFSQWNIFGDTMNIVTNGMNLLFLIILFTLYFITLQMSGIPYKN